MPELQVVCNFMWRWAAGIQRLFTVDEVSMQRLGCTASPGKGQVVRDVHA
jgi:hypothetical protein